MMEEFATICMADPRFEPVTFTVFTGDVAFCCTEKVRSVGETLRTGLAIWKAIISLYTDMMELP